jgi:hypothetical protein
LTIPVVGPELRDTGMLASQFEGVDHTLAQPFALRGAPQGCREIPMA